MVRVRNVGEVASLVSQFLRRAHGAGAPNMRILHVICTLNPSYGGPPRVATRLAAGQAGLGHDVTIATYRLTDRSEDFQGMTRLLPAFGRVRVAELDGGGLGESFFGSRSRGALRRLIAEADIVHLHNVWDPLVRTAGQEALRAGKPYLLQPNDILNPWSLSQKRLKKKLALTLSYRRIIEGTSAVLFGHSEEKRLVEQNGFQINPVVIALGGVFKEEVEPLPPRGGFFKRVPALRGRPYVVFLSRLHYKKGLDFLAEGFAIAARHLPEIQLVVIGHDEGAKAEFERRIAGHNLQDRVHLVGPMHGVAKWEAYRDATCFILPSRDEAFTVAITEALAASLPVVISESCHFDDVAEYQAGIIVELDADKIGAALIRLFSDPGLRANMSGAAHRLFIDRLSFPRVAQASIKVYEDCLRAGQPA
jgi:glycosyltransferase involved in cell wall biosynthesis